MTIGTSIGSKLLRNSWPLFQAIALLTELLVVAYYTVVVLGLFASPRGGCGRGFDFFDVRPLRGGAGRGPTAIVSLRARCPLFFSLAREASWGAPSWRCGAGFSSEVSLRARCPLFFFLAREASWGPPPRRYGAGLSSEMSLDELDVTFRAKLRKNYAR